jgi:hypothetical protein
MTQENSAFEPGDVVSGLEQGELVEIQRISPFGSKTLLEGVTMTSRRQIRKPLTFDEQLEAGAKELKENPALAQAQGIHFALRHVSRENERGGE